MEGNGRHGRQTISDGALAQGAPASNQAFAAAPEFE